MNCGVAFRESERSESSTYWPIEYQRADLRRCWGVRFGCRWGRRGGTHLLALGGVFSERHCECWWVSGCWVGGRVLGPRDQVDATSARGFAALSDLP
jgi:hypothetical protein